MTKFLSISISKHQNVNLNLQLVLYNKFQSIQNQINLQLNSVIESQQSLCPMLDTQAIKAIQIQGNPPHIIRNITFTQQTDLWNKHNHSLIFPSHNNIKKYEYFKMGKTLGLQTTRQISVIDDHLVYFKQIDSPDYLGFCLLQDLYVQWFSLKNHTFLFLLCNGKDTSLFYFKTDQFWTDQYQQIAKYAIQLDFDNRYQIINQIGQGSFSKVYKVRNIINGKIFAAKIISKHDKPQLCIKKMVMQEKKLLKLMEDSDCTSSMFEFFQTQKKYILVLQYLEGKDLMTTITEGHLTDIHQKKMMLNHILMILKECQRRQIIHRDIKPQNIIVGKDMKPKLIDFGLSMLHGSLVDDCNFKKCGTMGYIAPEIINCKFYKNPYTYKCDIFSVGIVAHLILLGTNPLKGRSYEQTKLINQKCSIKLNQEEIIEIYGENCLIFLQKLLETQPKLRYSIDQALNSPFLRENSDKDFSTSTLQSKRSILQNI